MTDLVKKIADAVWQLATDSERYDREDLKEAICAALAAEKEEQHE